MTTVKRYVRIAAGGALAALAACRTAHVVQPTDGGTLSAEVQYCASAGDAGDETAEVLVRNGTDRPVAFVRVELDGTELPLSAASVAKALRSFSFEGVRTRRPAQDPVAGVRWWQFYPSPRVGPGEAVAFQLNFDGRSRPCGLKLVTDDGRSLSARVPRYAAPRRRIEHLAFSGDGGVLTLRYSKGAAPDSLSVNGRQVAFRLLEAGAARPGALVADLPRPVRQGRPTLVELGFPDGARRFALVRAMLGLCTVAAAGRGETNDFRPPPEPMRREYGFDRDMKVRRIPLDVVCDDTRANCHGANARTVLATRGEWLARTPDGLCGVAFCTALYPSAWNIYSQMADAVISKPYKLHWGVNVSRFVDEEDAFLGAVVRDVAPRPVLWVPERFRKLRELEGDEFSVLAWCAMLRGVRGVRFHHWLNDPKDPFAGNPGLAAAVREFNAAFNRLRPRLERLVPAGESEDRARRTAVLEGWSGDDGVLLLVRNLRYDVGIDPQTRRRVRPFSVSPVRGHVLSYRLPKWLSPGAAVDALTGEAIAGAVGNGLYGMTLPELGAFRLVWIENAKKEVKQ